MLKLKKLCNNKMKIYSNHNEKKGVNNAKTNVNSKWVNNWLTKISCLYTVTPLLFYKKQ